MDHRTAKKTNTQLVYETLRADILACRLQPAQKLKINELAEHFNGSPGAVREALSRLMADGLVEGVAQKGYAVQPVSADELIDLTETRIDLECTCLAKSIQHGDVRWEGEVLAAGHELRHTPLPRFVDGAVEGGEWFTKHHAFHRVLVSACRSPSRLRLREVLHEQTGRYWHLLAGPLTLKRNFHGEHQALVEATLKRDAERAVALLRTHLGRTSEILLAEAAAHLPRARE